MSADKSIRVFEGILSPIKCQRMIDLVESRKQLESHKNPAVALITILSKDEPTLSKDYDFTVMDKELYNVFNEAIREYIKGFNSLAINNDQGYAFLRHEKGDNFNYHHDGSNRAVSAILGLNDDYEGGEIDFEHVDQVYKLKKGDMILFPSSYPFAYRLKSVTGGTRYSVVTWFIEQDRVV